MNGRIFIYYSWANTNKIVIKEKYFLLVVKFLLIWQSFYISLRAIFLGLFRFTYFSYFCHHLFCMCFIFTLFVFMSCLWVNSVVEIRLYKHTEQSLHNFLHFFVWLPLRLSNHLFTNITIFNVRMPNMSFKLNHWELEWELLGKIEIDY